MKPLEIKAIEGHVVLYCKGHYSFAGNDWLVGIRRIWATRWGLLNEHTEDKGADEYIANELFKLFKLLNPVKAEYFHEIMHKEICDNFRYEGLNSLERLILLYRSEIQMVQIREKRGKRYYFLVKLPNPKKKVFERILKGKGEYNDYKLIN